MAYCASCGQTLADGTTFCPHCGAPAGTAATPPPAYAGQPATVVPAAGTTGLQENVAAMLSYALGWITGIIFFLIDKRPAVRFHAAQSIVVFGGLHLLMFILGLVFRLSLFGGSVGFLAGFSLLALLSTVIWLLSVVLWIVLMIMAFQGRRFEVPIAAPFARQLAGANV